MKNPKYYPVCTKCQSGSLTLMPRESLVSVIQVYCTNCQTIYLLSEVKYIER